MKTTDRRFQDALCDLYGYTGLLIASLFALAWHFLDAAYMGIGFAAYASVMTALQFHTCFRMTEDDR